MHARTAAWRRGRTERSPRLKLRAKTSLAAKSSSATDKVTLRRQSLVLGRKRRRFANDQLRATNDDFPNQFTIGA